MSEDRTCSEAGRKRTRHVSRGGNWEDLGRKLREKGGQDAYHSYLSRISNQKSGHLKREFILTGRGKRNNGCGALGRKYGGALPPVRHFRRE